MTTTPTNPDLSVCDPAELKQRMSVLLSRLDHLLRETGPKLREIGLLRTEADIILTELRRRGIVPKDDSGKDGQQIPTPR